MKDELNDDQLTGEQQGALGPLRASRGDHPAAAMLLEYDALASPDRERHAAHDHVVICSRCQLVLLHAHEPSPSQARRAVAQMRAGGWLLPVAALLVLAVGVSLVWRAGALAPAAVEVETVRGTELQLTAPLGAVEIIRVFSWQSPLSVDRYRVTVRRGDTEVWRAETTGLSLAPPTGIFVRDVEYAWQVEAIDREGVVRMTSPSQSFVVY
jgi:hypothetical protein